MLTQERLKELLHYDPDTGVFTWLVSKGRGKAGSEAGTLNKIGYRILGFDGKMHRAHRMAFLYMEGEIPKEEIDHINRDKGDNRWSNLRHVSRSVNMRNRPLVSNNRSGVIGVCWSKSTGKWQVLISIESGKQKHLGVFEDFDEAVAVRKAAEVEHNYHENHGRDS